MSRITAIGFVMLDTVMSMATIVQSSLTLAVVMVTIVGSMALAVLSNSIRSIIWPSYFWDDGDTPPH